MMLLISDSLHNSLVILSVLFISFLFFLTLKELRELWQHVHIIYNKSPSSGSSNVLLLQSSQLSDLTDTLSSVDDTIEIHPRQIRRILRQALDSNIVKDVATSQPDSYLKQPTFNKINNEYILRVNHYQKQRQQTDDIDDDAHAATEEKEDDTTICFDFYFGVPKSYYFQIQSITNLSNKQSMMNEQSNTNTQTNTNKHTNDHTTSDNHHESPFKSLMALATTNTELRMERINSKSSFRSKSSIGMHDMETQIEMEPANEGIEMMQIATENIKHKSKSKKEDVITLQKLIPNEFVHRECVESKSGEDVHFDEHDLENTIATIIGNIKKRELIKKRGQTTKYKKRDTITNESAPDAKSDDEVLNDDGFYFCVLLSYVRHPGSEKEVKTTKRKAKTSNIVSNLFKKKRTIELQDVDLKCDDQIKHEEDEEKYEECAGNSCSQTAINTVEISIFDPPSAFLPRNQHQKQSKKSKKNVIKTNDETILIENALEPRLCFKLLCDFKLQRLVEYYDIFGISSDAAHANANLDCKICFSFPANIVLLPCRHCCCCLSCYKHIEQCPMCRKPIRQTLRWKSEIVD
eukprot:35763_1